MYYRLSAIVIAALLFTACATVSPPAPSEEYIKLVEDFSAGEVQYEGAYNNFNYRATLLSPAMQRVYIGKKSEVYLWSDEKRALELSALQINNDKSTRIFLSFFTPNRVDDNLSSPKSIWSVYLHIGNNRYEGKVSKNRDSRTEMNVLYPYHGRFASAYLVDFPVAVTQVHGQEIKVTITGPLGVKTVQFLPQATAL